MCPTPTTLSVHNLSSINLTQTELELLTKGLSFAPTPTLSYRETQLRLLSDYDQFAKNLRVTYEKAQKKGCSLQGEKIPLETTTTSFIHRQMKFLPKTPTSSVQLFSGIPRLDYYVELTKNNLKLMTNSQNFFAKLNQT